MAFQHVGRPIKRVEDPRLITGKDHYVNDVRLANALTLAFVRSPHAHALIKGIDATAARAVPGVVAVLTGADLNAEVGVIHTPLPPEMFANMNRQGYTMLAEGRARHVGQPVAVVAAESPAAAADGAEAVVVDYEPLPAVVDPEAALEPGSPLLYPEIGSNLGASMKHEQGDVEGAFRGAAVVVETKLVNQRVIPFAMEPRACSAVWDDKAQKLTIWGDTQIPHGMRDQIAERLKLKPEQVHLMTGRVGGGFGAKVPVYQEDTIVPLLARRLGRAVRWAASRQEDMLATGHGRDMRCELKLAADASGRIVALQARIVGNAGYCLYHVGVLLPVLCAQMITGCYDIQTGRVEALIPFTNTMGTVPYRGAGRPEATYFIERGMDLLAARLGLDPAEVRRRNFIPPDRFPYTTLLGNSYDSGEYTRALDHALAKARYPELRREQAAARAQGRLVGIGLASYVEICGFEDPETSDVEVADDGNVTVLTGAASHGQGHETAFAQLVADELQVPIASVSVVHGDTARVRSGVGTFGSRSIARGGMHALANAVTVREKAQQIAATLLEAAPADIVYTGGKFSVRGVPDRAVSWVQVAEAAKGTLTSCGDIKGNGMLFPFGSHVAMVEIDRETGQVRVVRYMSVDDAGFLINPLLVQGQVHGGLAQGIGQALLEQAVFDESGQLVSSTLMDYALPRTDDLISFENDHTRTDSPRTTLGVKGIGEAATIGSTPAIANAVMDALAPLGVPPVDIPLTAQKIWTAMRAAGVRR
ncbi:MAG TPA: xanthine dehydrogenase family protein molybdopterin-binding subunit [Methylomirabilota bacterium]|jgi:carbon-monoxide dehydrogenase large subunit|nr:xanthine dehydrogenase family protein molybdopterin-binding subunit [Methylomirabilota bacterium]